MTSDTYNDSEKRRDADFRDLNNELSGNETGQQKRFLPDTRSMAEIQKQEEQKRHEQMMTALMLMLQNDPAYAAQYKATMTLLVNAETVSEQALIDLGKKLDITREEFAECNQSANRTSDGTVVFKDKNGDVCDQNGNIIDDPVLLDSIVWKDNAPTYEEYIEKRDQLIKLQDDIEDIRRYQVDVLGDAREKLTDHDNPITEKETIKELDTKIRDQAPETVFNKISEPDILDKNVQTPVNASLLPSF